MSYDSKCPWCGVEQTDLFELDLNDSDECETECQDCGKDITIGCCISVDYEIKTRNCKLHKLVIGEWMTPGISKYVNIVCKICKYECYERALPGGIHDELKKGEFTIDDKLRKELERINFKGLDLL